VAAAFERPEADLEFARDGRCRPRHKRKLDRAMLDDIEDVLLRADLGTEVAARIATAVGTRPLRQGDLGG